MFEPIPRPSTRVDLPERTAADDIFLTAINDGQQYPHNVETAKQCLAMEQSEPSAMGSSAWMLWSSRAYVAIRAFRKEMDRQGETVRITREDARRVAGKLADYYLNHVIESEGVS